jgi:hypothetical protein
LRMSSKREEEGEGGGGEASWVSWRWMWRMCCRRRDTRINASSVPNAA